MLHPLSKESIMEDLSMLKSSLNPEIIQQKLAPIVSMLWNVKNNQEVLSNYKNFFGEDEIYTKLIEKYNQMNDDQNTFYFLVREEVRLMIHKIATDDESFEIKLTKEFVDSAFSEDDDFKLTDDAYKVIENILRNIPSYLFTGSRFEVLYNLIYISTISKSFINIRTLIISNIELYNTSYDLKIEITKQLIDKIVGCAAQARITEEGSRDKVIDKTITGSMIEKYLVADLRI